VLSEVDRRHFVSLGAERVVLVPHGIDRRCSTSCVLRRRSRRIVFLGNMSVPHNVDAAEFAAREVWPLVRAQTAERAVRLVGASPSPAVQRLAELPGVEVTGMCPICGRCGRGRT
jgi:hypothetical protein